MSKELLKQVIHSIINEDDAVSQTKLHDYLVAKMKMLSEEGAETADEHTINDDWFNEGSFKAFKKPNREPFEIAKHDGTITTLEGPVSYKTGDYIMTGPKGEHYPVSPENFAKLKDDNGDGTASPKKIIKQAKLADHDGYVTLSYNKSRLNFHKGQDVIVRHGVGDYGVVKKEIFDQTYQKQ